MTQRKAEIRKLLSNLPLFGSFTPEELDRFLDFFREETRLKGETICEAGEEGDCFYVVLSGELEVFAVEDDGLRLLNRLAAGDFFGELALILKERRTATVTVSRRATLLVLDRDAFNRFFLHNTKVIEYFSRVICQRLAAAASGQVRKRVALVISVAGLPGVLGKSLVATTTASLVGDYSGRNTLLISVGPAGKNALTLTSRTSGARLRNALRPLRPRLSQLKVGIRPSASRGPCSEAFSRLISQLSDDFPLQIIDLGAEPEGLIEALGDFTDVLVKVVVKAESGLPEMSHTRCYQVLNLHDPSTERVDINKCEPFVLPYDPALSGLDAEALHKVLTRRPLTPGAIVLQRLARKILGKSVGIAFGGGAAFGLAHLGVMQVLEQNDVPVDLVAGCSMGSLVAIGYAVGASNARLIQLARELGTPGKLFQLVLRDTTLARPGFLSGRGIKAMLAPYFGARKSFQDLLYPCRVVATELNTGERIILETGNLADVFQPSCSVPMVMAPVKRDGCVLVDGSVADPVPAEVVREMGADLCIAVNVVPPIKKGAESALSKAYTALNQFNPLAYFADSRDLPSIFDVVLKSLQTLQYELGNFKAISADLRINPDLSRFTWIDFAKNQEIVAEGVAAAEDALPAIQRMLARETL